MLYGKLIGCGLPQTLRYFRHFDQTQPAHSIITSFVGHAVWRLCKPQASNASSFLRGMLGRELPAFALSRHAEFWQAMASVERDMQLPHTDMALVTREKVVDYLLNAAHPDDGGKASFFTSLGFTLGDWVKLAAAFRKLAESSEVIKLWKPLTGGSIFLMGAWEGQVGRCMWFGRFGLSTVDMRRPGW